LVPAGTNGTVVITLDGGGGSMDIGVYRAPHLVSATAPDTASDGDGTDVDPPDQSDTNEIAAGGFVLMIVNYHVLGDATLTGVSEDFDRSNGDASPEQIVGGHASGLAAETGRTLTASGRQFNGCMCAASFA
jgi:hypothetical protein